MTDLGRQIGERAQAAAEATPPLLLDLVRQYGDERRQQGYAQANPADGMDVVWRHGETAQALFARIAALVVQQPVQARDAAGAPLWQHDCGQPWPFSDEAPPRNCPSCMTSGPWRPIPVQRRTALDVEVERYRRLLKTQASNFSAAIEEEIGNRDENAEWADRLAAAIAEFLRIDIGVHSNMNLPWRVALIALTDAVSPAQSDPLVPSPPPTLRLDRHCLDIVYRQLGDEPSNDDPRVAIFTGLDAEEQAAAYVAMANGGAR